MAMMERSSDGECSSDDDDSTTTTTTTTTRGGGASGGRRRAAGPMFPMPHSHWFPRSISFAAYVPPKAAPRPKAVAAAAAAARPVQGANSAHPRQPNVRLHIHVTRPLAYKVTKDIVVTYQTCNPEFAFSPDLNPKRYLTAPSATVSENGLDNEKHDLVLYFNQVLANDEGTRRYVVKDLVGSGTFGQVAKCYTEETNEFVAVKVIKNLPAYYTQARFEIGILHMLNKDYDPDDKYHIVRCIDHFQHHGHLCIVFELLTENLYELLKKTNLKGMSLVLVRMFTKQLLKSLSLLREARVIHCDLKPENILLLESFRSADLKLIDFGSACKEDQTVYTYIQSRFYRSPEVLLGHRYNTAIDMWSLGCVAAELFLGLPLFPGASDFDMLLFMKEKLESQPADHILRSAKYTNKFFKLLTAAPHSDHNHSAYQLLTPEEYETRHRKKPEIGRRYFLGTLADAIMGYPLKPTSAADQNKEIRARESFVDFLKGLIECDPRKRWSPQQAAQHPFITDEPYTGPYVPVPETPRTPLNQSLLIDHRGAAGHWVGTGLSPQVGGLNQGPHYTVTPNHFSHASSCGSAGSFGDGFEVEDYAMGMNSHQVGSSPESNWQARPSFVPPLQHPVFNQMRALNLGTSPSLNLGASPSHLYQLSPGPYGASPGGSFPSSSASSFSQLGSPNRYVPAPGSPGARLLEHAVVNATAAAQHHLHRRPWRGGGGAGAPPVPHVRPGRVPRGAGYASGTLGAYLSPGSSMDAADEDSGHWDPDFADELLQEDVPDNSRRTSVGRLSNCSSLDGTSPASSHSSASGYRPKPGQLFSTQTSPSRLGPQQTPQQQQQQQRHQRQQVSPEQTPLHRRPEVSGTVSFQQRQQFQFQQQQQQQQQQMQMQNLFNHQQHQQQLQHHQDVKTGSLLPSPQKDNRVPQMFGLNPPIPMIAGIGHPMHAVNQPRFYGGEELHHQFAGGFLPQNQYFTHDLYFAGPKPPMPGRR